MTVHKIGESVARQENERLITGRVRFTDDLKFDNEAFLAVVQSDHAGAAIRAVDCKAARSMDGVIAVLTSREMKEDGLGAMNPPFAVTSPDGTPMYTPELLPLATNRALPAVISVICDALAPCGIHHIEMPATPMRIWQAPEDASVCD